MWLTPLKESPSDIAQRNGEWMDDLKFEVVPDAGHGGARSGPPRNLNFEK
jgi:hypothetical protein